MNLNTDDIFMNNNYSITVSANFIPVFASRTSPLL